MKELLANMPLEHAAISNDIIAYAKEQLKLRLNQSIYVTLTDHINFAIERIGQGIKPENALLCKESSSSIRRSSVWDSMRWN